MPPLNIAETTIPVVIQYAIGFVVALMVRLSLNLAAVGFRGHYALGGPARWPLSHQPFQPVWGSTTGRISIEPYLLEGQRLAQAMASSRLGTSTKK